MRTLGSVALAIVALTALCAPLAGAQERRLRPPVPADGIPPRAPGQLVDAADARQARALESLKAASPGLKATIGTGRSIAVGGRVPVTGDGLAAQGRDFLARFGEDLWRLGPNSEMVLARTDDSTGLASFTQRYRGLPVIGGGINVIASGRHVYGAFGAALPGDGLDTTPAVSAQQARDVATARTGKVLAPPQLAVSHLRDGRAAERVPLLVWVVPVLGPDGAHSVHVDAQTATVVRKLSMSMDSAASHANYDALWWDSNESWGPCGADVSGFGLPGEVEVGDHLGLISPYSGFFTYDMAWTHTRRAHAFYYDVLGRDSYDDNDGHIVGRMESAHTDNAMWRSICDDLSWGPGYGSSDTPTHEFTHGVTQFTSGLIYENESGAINESFSDIMAAFNDVDGDRWLHGEDRVPDPGPARNLMNAPKDRYSEYVQELDDEGGVHSNSGIGNKAAYLLTEGGTHDETDRPVTGIGAGKASKLLYAAHTSVSDDSDYAELRAVASIIATTWATQDRHGFTPADVCSVRNAYAAVEIGTGDVDCDGTEDGEDMDLDGDGVRDGSDNCLWEPNPTQADAEWDGSGDACDPDDDDDGVADADDNCPTRSNSVQADSDFNGVGDLCDDEDGDLWPDGSDNCPDVYNPGQEDSNGDGDYGDACDPDGDGDGVPASEADNCPNVSNSDQADADGDGYGNACDPCPSVTDATPAFDFNGNPHQPDSDGDGIADDCDRSLQRRDGAPVGEGLPQARVELTAVLSIEAAGRVAMPLLTCPPPCAETDATPALDLELGALPAGVTAMVTDSTGQAWARSASLPDGGRRLRFTPRGDRQYFLTFLAGEQPAEGAHVALRSFGAAPPKPSPADVSLEISTGAGPVSAGGTIDYTVAVANETLSEATGVAVQLAGGDGLTIPDGARSVGTLAAGETRELQFTAQVGPDVSGSVSATASLTATTVDPVPDNDSASAVTTVTDPFVFGGFRPPIDAPPVVNTGRAGRTYPVKFQVTDDGGKVVSDLAAVSSVKAKRVACGAFTGDPADAIELVATDGEGLRFEDDQFAYKWKTPALAGCYELFVALADGGAYRANFRLG